MNAKTESPLSPRRRPYGRRSERVALMPFRGRFACVPVDKLCALCLCLERTGRSVSASCSTMPNAIALWPNGIIDSKHSGRCVSLTDEVAALFILSNGMNHFTCEL